MNESTVSAEIFLGTAHNIFAKDDAIACYAQVTLASIEGTGDELRIRGRMDPLTSPIEQAHIDEHIKVAISARKVQLTDAGRAYALGSGFKLADGIDDVFADRLIYIWDQWNDNAHRPGCEHQTRLGWIKDPDGVLTQRVGTPCPFCRHAFNTDPQYEPLPYDVVDFVETKLLGAVEPDEINVTTLEGEARPLSQIRKTILRKADARIAVAKHALIEGQDYVVEDAGDGMERRRLTMSGLRKLAEAGDISATARMDRIERFGWQPGDVEVVEPAPAEDPVEPWHDSKKQPGLT